MAATRAKRSHAPGGELGELLVDDARPALEEARLLDLRYPICNSDRAVGARLAGEIASRFGGGAPPGRVSRLHRQRGSRASARS